MNALKKFTAATVLAGALCMVQGTSAHATRIGIDPDGAGGVYGMTYADHWVNQTDTGLATDFLIGKTVPIPNDPYNITFTYQAAIATMTNAGLPVTPIWMLPPNPIVPTYQITLVTKLTETVVSDVTFFDASGHFHESANFTSGANGSVMSFYISKTDTAADQANPNLVANYTNGVHIFDADIVNQTSSFDLDFTTGQGTGSFDVLWQIDPLTVNSAYVDVLTDLVFGYNITGTTNIPAFYHPTTMWDGTPVTAGIPLKVDGSEEFNTVPEPGTFLLLGAGLAALGFVRRSRKG